MHCEDIEYSFLEGDDFDVEATLDGVCVGYANCIRVGNRVQLADLQIVESLPRRRRTLLQRLGLVRETPTVRLRYQGIGTKLLTMVLTAMDEAGIGEVWGIVTDSDLNAQPWLLCWYERHGFTIHPPDAECKDLGVAKIVRTRPLTS